MILEKGPVYAGEYGSAFPVKAKQRPQASPGPVPGVDPNASWLIAAVKPLAAFPQAGLPHPEYMVKLAVPEALWTYPPLLLGGVPVLVGGTEVGVVVVVGLDVVIGVVLVLELDAVPGRHWE